MTRRLLVTTVLAVAVANSAYTATDPRKALEGIDELIVDALEEQKIPGASVAVIVDGEVVLLKGYGLRDVERDLPMTPDTIIPVASVTKQFTVASLGTLVRRGKLEWDEPVRNYLPEFRLADDYATLYATPRDLVTHRIGLPRHDFSWFGSPLEREDLYGRLRHLPFSEGIRTTFQYNNFMYMTAGLLGGRVAGKSYEQHVMDSVIEPVGLTRTGFSLESLAADPDHATGYELDNDLEAKREEFTSAEAMAPTGALNSTARDLARWIQMLLNDGEIDGRRILLASDVRAMMTPAMPVGVSMFPEFGHRMYGMGFFVQNYRGVEVASHGGNMPGAAANVVLVPKEDIGIVVLTNRSYARLRDGLPYEILDRLLGLESAGLVQRYADIDRRVRASEAAAKEAGVSDRIAGTNASHSIEEYAGRYEHPGYGIIDISLEDGRLAMTYNGFTAPLEHWHYDVFRTPEDRTSELDRMKVLFRTNFAGAVHELTLPIEPSVSELAFHRLPPAELTDPAFLAKMTGVYEVGGVDREIRLREDGVLQYVVFGNVYDLVPLRDMRFQMKDFADVTIEFIETADGTVDRMAIHDSSSTIGRKK